MFKKRVFAVIVVIIGLSTIASYADGDGSNEEEIISKHKAKIEKANSQDWKTYADCAKALVSRRITSEEVLTWIDQSIEIKETVYNRVIKGDYLVTINRIRDAQREYVRAIELAMESNQKNDIAAIQWKILISMGIENYNRFQAENQK